MSSEATRRKSRVFHEPGLLVDKNRRYDHGCRRTQTSTGIAVTISLQSDEGRSATHRPSPREQNGVDNRRRGAIPRPAAKLMACGRPDRTDPGQFWWSAEPNLHRGACRDYHRFLLLE